jgi:hypothetical protein
MAPRSLLCELSNGKRWIPNITIEQALDLPPYRKKRCPECYGRVRAHRPGDGAPARFEHFERHPGCSLGDCFDGNKRPHPGALNV